jgi:glycerophosphoryl diester phosphodiesterase
MSTLQKISAAVKRLEKRYIPKAKARRFLTGVSQLSLSEFGSLNAAGSRLAPRIVRNLRTGGVRVHAWTVNETRDIERCLDLNVDGILSDRPDLVRMIISARLPHSD